MPRKFSIGPFLHVVFGREEENNENRKIPVWIWILGFIFNVIIIVLAILRILFPGNLLAICQRQNAFFTSLTETQIGISFLAISILGTAVLSLNIASKHPFVILSRAYLAALLVVTFVLCILIIVGFVVTKGAAGEEISGKAYNEYRLQSYSSTLQAKSISSPWNATRSCLVDTNICKRFIDSTITKNITQFNATSLSPVESLSISYSTFEGEKIVRSYSGCCKPSNDCGFILISPTKWMKPKNANMTNNDCGLWSHDNKELCYDCDACKAGMLQSVSDSWRKQGFIYVGFDVFLSIVLIVGFYAFPWDYKIDPDSLEVTIIKNLAGLLGSKCCC